jgi:hypothetical protein
MSEAVQMWLLKILWINYWNFEQPNLGRNPFWAAYHLLKFYYF